jgi:hypothetical protein
MGIDVELVQDAPGVNPSGGSRAAKSDLSVRYSAADAQRASLALSTPALMPEGVERRMPPGPTSRAREQETASTVHRAEVCLLGIQESMYGVGALTRDPCLYGVVLAGRRLGCKFMRRLRAKREAFPPCNRINVDDT